MAGSFWMRRDVRGKLLNIAVYLISASAADSHKQEKSSKQFSYLKGYINKPVTPEQMQGLLCAL